MEDFKLPIPPRTPGKKIDSPRFKVDVSEKRLTRVVEEYGLSPEEAEVLPLLLDTNFSFKQISEVLKKTEVEIDRYIKEIYSKVAVRDRLNLILKLVNKSSIVELKRNLKQKREGLSEENFSAHEREILNLLNQFENESIENIKTRIAEALNISKKNVEKCLGGIGNKMGVRLGKGSTERIIAQMRKLNLFPEIKSE